MYLGFNKKTILNVCKECEERYEACHDYCEKYKEAKKQWEDRKSVIRTERYKYQNMNGYQIEAIKRFKKSR